MTRSIELNVNGKTVSVETQPVTRLSEVLRDKLGLTGTKVGCNAGDCGACTVTLDGEQVCSCLTPVIQAEGKSVTTVEGLAQAGSLNKLQQAFSRHGAAQCGICSPGMLMAASSLLAENDAPSRDAVEDALGGVLCRCTGYQKIVDAVMDAAGEHSTLEPEAGQAVGASIAKLDAEEKLNGLEKYGADNIPENAFWVRILRSPYPSASVEIGDMSSVIDAWNGLHDILTYKDIPFNRFGIYPVGKDQPVLTDGVVRYRGDAVVAVVGTKDVVQSIGLDDLPIKFLLQEPVIGLDAARSKNAAQLHEDKPENVLISGHVAKGSIEQGLNEAAAVTEGSFQTRFVEHAYIEPEAGWAQRVGDRVEVTVTTQAVHIDLDEIANVLQVEKERVRVIPTAVGGGFGGKLDVSIQPILAVAAMKYDRPVAYVYERPESMAASTKRHPSEVRSRFAADKDGKLVVAEMTADFDTGAYASWGPTVAGRVPVHGSGPYFVPNVHITGRGLFTNAPPAGAFRGFGVPQAAIAHETMMDDLAEQLGMDRLEIRLKNAIRVGEATATGQVLQASAGMAPCLEELKPGWGEMNALARAFNEKSDGVLRRGVGIGAMWYGIGNTSLSNPSTMEVGINKDGKITLYNGAVDIGQGSNTIMPQICADAAGLPVSDFHYIMGDSDLTEDAGKTSASRQTFVSGKASELAGLELRQQILRHVNAGEDAIFAIEGSILTITDKNAKHEVDLTALPEIKKGNVFFGSGNFDPPTSPLDENGQGVPYATYGFAAQIALVEVDTQLGTTKVIKIIAAHDVGQAINPQLVEGQIHGGIAQGLGLALMEEFVPGVTENLHDYLIPTFGDMPDMEILIVEDAEPLGPFGAKGVGEPGLVPTAPAIFGAVRHATGVRVTEAPLLPHRLKAALNEKEAAQ
ncbi:molybdopterin-dependent oxidoreductase [Sneathiella aquimaris]|uniref:molybdopterin-dependent oxidoreductase n=1 Tax=Sneathiella aquimaris TaxID=2599305 RepID=UPI00146BD860|nr:molybdopterin cofactor-binding domain-containing protein [Sneathiella aquimaris]